jgi:hypothetical protein
VLIENSCRLFRLPLGYDRLPAAAMLRRPILVPDRPRTWRVNFGLPDPRRCDRVKLEDRAGRALRRARCGTAEWRRILRQRSVLPWVSAAPTVAEVATFVLPECPQIIPFHLVTAGFCWCEIEGDPASSVRLEAGDAIILVKGDEHFLSSTPGLREPQNLDDYRRAVERGRPLSLVANGSAGGPEACHFICGYVGCDARPFNPLLDALPRIVCAQPSAESRELLEKLVRAAVAESPTHDAGEAAMLARLAELIFVDVIRRYIEDLRDDARSSDRTRRDSDPSHNER